MTDPKTDTKTTSTTAAPPAPAPKDDPPPTPDEILAGIAADLGHMNYPEVREHIQALHGLLIDIVGYLQIPVEPSPPAKGK